MFFFFGGDHWLFLSRFLLFLGFFSACFAFDYSFRSKINMWHAHVSIQSYDELSLSGYPSAKEETLAANVGGTISGFQVKRNN